ncbi:hypothetical protein LG52_1071 [Geobacillus kaustophilus]|uniref:Uncharacterized protein n=1 Tax=Geobacillus kaustophilus TaxID=1462 RepID=A0A0D8BY67_GEOKU|nr:hypothetical protein LG52_1071 [Geobacillus kaustophilus]
MTGIRSWMGTMSSFALVVMIVHVSSGPLGPSQRSHNPANANGSPDKQKLFQSASPPSLHPFQQSADPRLKLKPFKRFRYIIIRS